MTVDVEDGRAVRIGGDPDHRFTQGFLCAKVNHYLERVYSPERHPAPAEARRAQGRGAVRARSPGTRRSTPSRRASARSIAAHGPQAILPYSYAGNMGLLSYGSMDRRFFQALGASLLDRTICASAGAAGLKATLGKTPGPRPGGGGARAAHRGLGRQHRQLQRAPLAVRRGGAAARGPAGGHRPLPLAHGGEGRPAPGAAAGHRRRAGPGHDARDLPRRAGGRGLPGALHGGRREAARARARVDARRGRRRSPACPRTDRGLRARIRDHASRPPSASTTA